MNSIKIEEVPYQKDPIYRIEGKRFLKKRHKPIFESSPIFIKFYENLNLDLTIYDEQILWKDETHILDLDENIIKEFPTFMEFFIDEIPFSYHLDFLFKNKTPILFNFAGILGNSNNAEFEKLHLKQLLNIDVHEKEILQLYNFDKELSNEEKLNELKDNWDFQDLVHDIKRGRVGIYRCPSCQSGECGGYEIEILENESSFVWLIRNKSKNIELDTNGDDNFSNISKTFEFEKSLYKKTFKEYYKKKWKKSI